jgi:CheY-like chemotaxis protein
MAAILIVEDRPIDRRFLAAVLRSGGHTVVEASDGVDALALIARASPDLIISDILMPTIDGYELVRRIREFPEHASIPVIF